MNTATNKNQVPVQGGQGTKAFNVNDAAFVQLSAVGGPGGAVASSAVISNNTSGSIVLMFDSTLVAVPATGGIFIQAGASFTLANKNLILACWIRGTIPSLEEVTATFFTEG